VSIDSSDPTVADAYRYRDQTWGQKKGRINQAERAAKRNAHCNTTRQASDPSSWSLVGVARDRASWQGVARAGFWHSTDPVQVGASGINIVLRHPKDMRSPSQAIAYRLPMCSEQPSPLARLKNRFGY